MKSIIRHQRKSVRGKKYDCSRPGKYFITICTHNYECILGEILNEEMRLNDAGNIAEKCWKEIPNHFQNVKLDEFVVMPNHVHGIAVLNESVGIEYIQPNTKNINAGIQNLEPLQNTYQHIIPKSLGSIIRSYKAAVAHECKKNDHPDFRWQRSFYEHIIRNDRELHNIRNYITNNVLQWTFDKDNPENIPKVYLASYL
jgi:REP element-mobilizing transposase RayT